MDSAGINARSVDASGTGILPGRTSMGPLVNWYIAGSIILILKLHNATCLTQK